MNPVDSLTQQLRGYLTWNKSHLDVLSTLVIALIKKRTVNLTQLATTFPGTSQTLSCYRRIQRFFAQIAFEDTVFALLIARLLSPEGAWMLSMDRTNWMTGDALNEDKPITVKSHGRKAQSIFRAGLDHLQRIFDHIETWLDEFFWSLRLLFQP